MLQNNDTVLKGKEVNIEKNHCKLKPHSLIIKSPNYPKTVISGQEE